MKEVAIVISRQEEGDSCGKPPNKLKVWCVQLKSIKGRPEGPWYHGEGCSGEVVMAWARRASSLTAAEMSKSSQKWGD